MTLCDASPLIALINEGDDNHQRRGLFFPLLPERRAIREKNIFF
jgi:hypothetical protein